MGSSSRNYDPDLSANQRKEQRLKAEYAKFYKKIGFSVTREGNLKVYRPGRSDIKRMTK